MKKNLPCTLPRRIVTTLAAIGCALFTCHSSAVAQCQYEVTAIIQGPPCGPSQTPAVLVGRGMNSHSHVVGSWRQCLIGTDEAFYWTPETGLVTMTRPPGIASAIATGINDNGTIIGAHRASQFGQWLAFVYHPDDDQYTYLSSKHPEHLSASSSLNAINNAGIAVGARVISKPGVTPVVSNAVIWDTSTGEVIDLGVGEGPNSVAMDVNEAGDAVGWSGSSQISNNARALIWSKGLTIHLGMLPGTIQSTARSINIHRDAIGSCGEGIFGPYHSFLWTNGKMVNFPVPDGYASAGGSDLNDVGQIVGGMRLDSDAPLEPFLLQHGVFHRFVDLIDDLPPNLIQDFGLRLVGNDGRILAQAGTIAVLLVPLDQPIGDLNHDCRVNVHDLLLLLHLWETDVGTRGQSASPADLNGDGVIDVSDLLILLANWSP